MPREFEIAPGRLIGDKHPCFIISEIGQNHQGQIELAKRMIKLAKENGADCVKFQKSCLTEKFTKNALARPYTSLNSWGDTYGEHKKFLEFSIDQFKELQEYANKIGILFSSSAMDQTSIDDLDSLNIPFLKIGSGDINNFPMIEYATTKNRPIIISTGMADLEMVKKVYGILKSKNAKFCILHCVSSYPTPVDQVNLNVLESYLKEFPDIPIGYSGHELGTSISLAAVVKGAKVLERHITLDRSWRGSDHKCSLLPQELGHLIREIRILESALGSPTKRVQPSELACKNKLGKSIVARISLTKGTRLEKSMLCVKVAEPHGIDANYLENNLGRNLIKDIEQDEPIQQDDLEQEDG